MADNKINVSKGSYVYGVLIVSILGVILVGFLLIRPLLQDNTKQQKIIDNRVKTIKTLSDKKSKLEKISMNSKDILEKAKKVGLAIPDKENKKQLAYALYTIALNSGLILESVEDSVSADATLASDAPASTATLSSAHEETFTLSLKGSYEGLVAFLDSVKTALRIVTVNNIDAQEGDNTLDIKISITTYTTGDIVQNGQL